MITQQQRKIPQLRGEKTKIKRCFARRAQQVLYLSGIARLYARLLKQNQALILMYHSVVDEKIAPFIDPENSITVKQFESHLNVLQKSCNVIRLSELVICLRDNKPILPNTVVITFDDGYLDNHVNAAPLLAKYNMPASLFLATRYIESAEPQWIDRLYSLFQFRSRHVLTINGLDGSFDLSDQIQLEQAYVLIKKLLRTSCFQERKELLEHIEAQLKPSAFPPRLTLNWDDVRHLQEQYPLFELGIHTCSHQDLTLCENKQAEHEIRQSRHDYQRELDCEPSLFSYPYGRHSPALRTSIENSGFLGAVSTQPTYLINQSTDPYDLPRLPCPRSLLDLKVWLSGAFPELAISLWGKACD